MDLHDTRQDSLNLVLPSQEVLDLVDSTQDTLELT